MSDLGRDVSRHDREEEVLLVLPLALQHDPGLKAGPGAGPVLPPVLLVLAGPEPALTQPAQQADNLPAYLEWNMVRPGLTLPGEGRE